MLPEASGHPGVMRVVILGSFSCFSTFFLKKLQSTIWDTGEKAVGEGRVTRRGGEQYVMSLTPGMFLAKTNNKCFAV